MNEKQEKLAASLLKAVGGKDNVNTVTHCMTRLRFNLKDKSIPDKNEIKQISGVLGIIEAGGQFQIIIGQTVNETYEYLCRMGNFTNEDNSISEKAKEKITAKYIGNSILNALAGCLTPLIPVMIAASMFKMVVAIFGPQMLGIIKEGTNLYTLLTFVGDAGFYFFPVMIGYTTAKKFGATPVIGIFLGAILIHPTFITMAAQHTPFSVFGIPCTPQNYASSVLPALLSVWILSYVEKFFNKHITPSLRTVFAPTLSIAVMLPVSLCILSPAGGFLGNYICKGLLGLGDYAGFIAVALIAALWEFLVMSGMHLLMITTLIMVFSQNGSESMVSPAGAVASIATAGMVLGAALRIRNKEQKGLAWGYFVASLIGGVTEPGLYGVGIRYKKTFRGLIAGGFAGGLYAGLTKTTAHAMVPVASLLGLTGFAGGPVSDIVNGCIACGIGFAVAAVVTYFFGFNKDDPALLSTEEKNEK
jgi:beta-glucoside PTS system EIICBA component